MECTTNICSNMYESQNKYAEWNKIKKTHEVWFHLYKILEHANQPIVAESRRAVA